MVDGCFSIFLKWRSGKDQICFADKWKEESRRGDGFPGQSFIA
jgi:hypothetical protein